MRTLATIGINSLVAEGFTDEDDGVFASGGVAEEVDVVADALGGVAVVADTVGLTGCVDVETGGVDGRSGAAGTGEGCLYGLGDLVDADDEDDLLRAPGDGGDTVAVAVDVDDDAVFGDGIGAGEIDIGGEGTDVHLHLRLIAFDEVTVEHVVTAFGTESIGDADVADGHRATPGDAAASGDEFQHFADGLFGCRTIECLHIAAGEIFDHTLGQAGVA